MKFESLIVQLNKLKIVTQFLSYSIESNDEIPDEFYNDLNNALKNYNVYDLFHGDIHFGHVSGITKFGMPTFRYSVTLSFKL